MSTLIRQAKDLPPELSSVEAWKARLRSEPTHVVLADAYEYNLWSLDENGIPALTEHPIHETTLENFLYSSSHSYGETMVEVMRRRGLSPYEHLMDDAREAGLPEKALETMSVCLRRIEESARGERARASSLAY